MFTLTNHPDSKEAWEVAVSCWEMSDLLNAMDTDEPTSIPVPSPSIQQKEAIRTVELLNCMEYVRTLNEELCSTTPISTERLEEIITQVTKTAHKVFHLKKIPTFDWICPNPEMMDLIENVYSLVNSNHSLLVYTISEWKSFKRTDDLMYYLRKGSFYFPYGYTYDDYAFFMRDKSATERFMYLMNQYHRYSILRSIVSLLKKNDNFPVRSWWRLYAHEDSVEKQKSYDTSDPDHYKKLLKEIKELNPTHPDLDWLVHLFE